ncbi:hypothetical protein [Gloeocapsopsis dulcis]|uniref:Glutathione S-transferase n=1 Tax=Gloeocapsopsis dulcis AAB1 = 1H9 TaxID=1433147 RepID=A0A6N8FR69_9CHRO|nr:hypothetical protein [Gloeocapsopsis dulcis]MUL35102.1 hypothetical protein [Gloeocapsopsis dulcis AAB1 = 1H9]WNN88984.1 hypothetical protein P0S91_22455 [Gloeocapsopsis dulcis]
MLKIISKFSLSTSAGLVLGWQAVVLALPPPEDIPEEVLRTEIITDARSPIDGKPLTAAEYADLQAQLQNRPVTPPLSPQVREAITLLRLRRLIRTLIPFLPI